MTTILLVEDAPDLTEVIARELERLGWRVLRAPDGQSGLALHGREHPDLVVLDWMLPGMEGLDVLRQIRQESVTPVLMLTARGDELDRVVGLEVGADDYLTKPFSMRELIARIRALLRRDELLRRTLAADLGGGDEPLSYGSLSLDPQARLVRLSGQPLDVTPNEFGLLQLLMRRRVTVLAHPVAAPVWALADAVRLEQVLRNLIANAVRHTPPGGVVLLAAEGHAEGATVAVRDTGEGMAAADLQRVFERFYRSDSARTREPGGAGLGLALVKELVEAMGGSVTVMSAPGEGSTFTVRLPAACCDNPATLR